MCFILAPQRKRARVRTGPTEVEDIPDFDDDFEITPPPSPDVSDVIKMQRNSKAAVRLPASETLEQYQDRLVKGKVFAPLTYSVEASWCYKYIDT